MVTRSIAAITVALALQFPTPLWAGFDPDTGKVVVDDAAFGLGFESATESVERGGLTVFDLQLTPYSETELIDSFVDDEAIAIEGSSVFSFGGQSYAAYLDLRPLADQFRGRRVEIRLWVRPMGTTARVELEWYEGNADSVFQRGEAWDLRVMGQLPFKETGRATDDGWVEMSSGPVDFALAHRITPQTIQLQDAHVRDYYYGYGALDPKARVWVDGLEILDLGEAIVPDAICRITEEAATCGEYGICQYGRCADGATLLGGVFQNERLRHEYVDRRIFELRSFEGGREPIARMDGFEQTLGSVRDSDSAARFWTAFLIGFDALADGHASAPLTTWRSTVSPSVCAHLGEADLLPNPQRLPLVFEAPLLGVGARLNQGDALVAIDGLEPYEWAEHAPRTLGYGGDPRGREVILAPQLLNAAAEAGSVATFARCVSTSTSAPTACDESELEIIEIDFAAELAGIWDGQAPSWADGYADCDFRFRRAINTSNARDYAFAGFVDNDGVRSVQFNGVPSAYGQGGQQWHNTMNLALSDGPEQMILDERRGGGGSIDAVDLLGGYLLAPDELHAMELFPQLDQSLDPSLRESLKECSQQSVSVLTTCGDYFEWRLAESHPDRGAASQSKVAVLTGLDVSGNDFLTKLLTYRQAGQTRIFGPAPTYGAFGVVWVLAAHGGEYIGGSFQVHDTVFVEQPNDPNLEFTTGFGVPPDEVLLQTQSDAVRGVDTAMEAARAWLSAE